MGDGAQAGVARTNADALVVMAETLLARGPAALDHIITSLWQVDHP